MEKPDDVFDREREWEALTEFASAARPGASLGLVYGRRRQGKTYLMQALVESGRGLYFAALRQSGEQNLQRLAEAYRQFTAGRARVAFSGWEEAFEALLALGQDAERPVMIVLDEFPYLLGTAPELPSVLQALLSPRGAAARAWRSRLLLCGSALSTMRGLLAGSAPLRGRAGLELVVQPFKYREAARYWGVADPELAIRLHALVGGTPAYLDLCGGSGPEGPDRLDPWVVRTLLNPASAMFREGNVLLAEDEVITDTSTYFGVLAAISQGRTRRGEIAAAMGRPQGALAHPLAVLTQARLVAAQHDALRDKRATFQVAEPVLRLHQLVIAPNEARLARHRGDAVWAAAADTVSSKIYGPHFEWLARTWCSDWASEETLGGLPDRVAPTVISCRHHRSTHELDVVAVESRAGLADRILAIGEAKWRTQACDVDQLHRLEHLRTLLTLPDTVKLLLFGRRFTPELLAVAAARDDVELVDPARLYSGE